MNDFDAKGVEIISNPDIEVDKNLKLRCPICGKTILFGTIDKIEIPCNRCNKISRFEMVYLKRSQDGA